ncbi:GYF domain-containing protein [Halobacteriovorax sp. HFRX-2_2]|uniref:GYF domain-containing protein n=1 Tax=unclassified Halobacteriovorax TaxID=2639665 RepID=UPI0037182BF1
MAQWYYVEKGERVGPVELEEVEVLFGKGKLTPDSYVWTKGFDNWKLISEATELGHLLNKRVVDELPPELDMPPVIDDQHVVLYSWDDIKDDEKIITIKIGLDRGTDEVEYGPFSVIDLQKAYQQNRINEKTLAYIPGENEWVFLAETPIAKRVMGSVPPLITDDERRLNQRKPFVARMFFHDSQQVFEGVCRDISIGGMQVLVSNFPFNVGDEVTLNVHPENTDYHFIASGLVVRHLNENQGFALRFVNLSDEAESSIKSYIG